MRTSPLRSSGVDHTVLPANTPHLPFPCSSPEGATTEWTVIAPADEAYYSLIDPMRMKGWVGLVGWPTVDGLPIYMVTHQLQVRCRPVKVCRSDTDVLPLSNQTECLHQIIMGSYNWTVENFGDMAYFLSVCYSHAVMCHYVDAAGLWTVSDMCPNCSRRLCVINACTSITAQWMAPEAITTPQTLMLHTKATSSCTRAYNTSNECIIFWLVHQSCINTL